MCVNRNKPIKGPILPDLFRGLPTLSFGGVLIRRQSCFSPLQPLGVSCDVSDGRLMKFKFNEILKYFIKGSVFGSFSFSTGSRPGR